MARDPLADLRRIAFLLERSNQASYRVKAFRGAVSALAGLAPEDVAARAAAGTLTDLNGIGEVTARCVVESLRGEEPSYLRRLTASTASEVDEAAAGLRRALRGDCHAHSDWSDGGSPIEELVTSAIELGHSYLVLTDHSPRLAVARGLSAARLRQQLDVVAQLNAALGQAGVDFRLLTGVEVDILADGTLDQEESLLATLDVVVGSIHSDLRADPDVMTRRMLTAIANPHLDILGHCTGRRLAGDPRGGDQAHRGGAGRPESRFDAEAVFAACASSGTAIEINCRPDRLDPPQRLLRRAYELGCLFAINTDAHAPGQLDWLPNGCGRAAGCGVEPERVINVWPTDRLLGWAAGH